MLGYESFNLRFGKINRDFTHIFFYPKSIENICGLKVNGKT